MSTPTPVELLQAAREIFARNVPGIERSSSAYAASSRCTYLPAHSDEAECFCGRGALLNAAHRAGLRNDHGGPVNDSQFAPAAYHEAREALDAAVFGALGVATIAASDAGLLTPEHFDAAIARLRGGK